MPTPLRLTAAAVIALTLAACGTPPKPGLPDGEKRTPLNQEAAAAEFMAQQAADDARDRRQAELEAQVGRLQKQVTELKAYIVVKQAEVDINTRKGLEPPPPSNLPKARPLVEFNDKTLVVHLLCASGASDCAPTSEVRARLKGAIDAGARFDVRGRTDADHPSSNDRELARARAAAAQRLLVEQGVPPERIRTSFEAAGFFAVDNRSAEGKARNRRVEIEARGLAVSLNGQ